ncbi:MAG: four helix bundle protein [Bacteroides sp.]|uniref:four helix bundle protein n=1 Tax=Bacteroides sp. TaxID=29523 RepID=UPI0026E035DD|nr:four helix bundle protein [Bacteroides sp.]MDO5420701.1 four helix bundle protein [Bacteroides sp.]
MRENLIKEKSKKFAIRIVRLYQILKDERKEFVMSKQILRSGTSIGANVCEGIYAESCADLVHKYSISQKECSETIYWLDLLYSTDFISEKEFTSISEDCVEVLKLLTAAIISLKKKSPTP